MAEPNKLRELAVQLYGRQYVKTMSKKRIEKQRQRMTKDLMRDIDQEREAAFHPDQDDGDHPRY